MKKHPHEKSYSEKMVAICVVAIVLIIIARTIDGLLH